MSLCKALMERSVKNKVILIFSLICSIKNYTVVKIIISHPHISVHVFHLLHTIVINHMFIATRRISEWRKETFLAVYQPKSTSLQPQHWMTTNAAGDLQERSTMMQLWHSLHDTLRGMFQSWLLSYGNVSGIHGYLLKPNIHLVAMANENFVYPSPRMTPPCRVWQDLFGVYAYDKHPTINIPPHGLHFSSVKSFVIGSPQHNTQRGVR